jgi:hypothetical protein
VTCIDCHTPHGNGHARNLIWPSDPPRTPEMGLFSNPTASGMARYEEANVSYGTLNSTALREPTNICLDCHHVFTGGWYVDPEDNDIHNLHPSYDSERASRNHVAQGDESGTTVSTHWLGGTGSGFEGVTRVRFVQSTATSYVVAKQLDATKNGVFCLTCHRAHGSDRPFGLTFVYNPGNAASKCDQCHLKANVVTPEPEQQQPSP